MSRRVWVSIFFEMPGRLRWSTPVRAHPAWRAWSVCSTMLVHFVANSSSTRRGAQSSRHASSALSLSIVVTFPCL